MKTVIRHDRAAINKPTTTDQGFLRASGNFSRAGIYEYRNDDGTIRYELRPKEEVQHLDSLNSFESAPITIGHPPEGEVTSNNVKKYEVGNVSGSGRADGDYVAGDVVIKDAKAIQMVKGGLQELSPGYRIKLDEKAGFDKRYAYPGNPTGKYHCIQRDIRVNHLAIVPKARGGSTVRLRMDSAEGMDWRFDAIRSPGRTDSNTKLTTVVDGHQHAVDLAACGTPWSPSFGSKQSGCTSYAVSDNEKSEHGHNHDWIRNADGSITISMSEGHTHAVIDDNAIANLNPGPRYDGVFDQTGRRNESSNMDKDEQIRSLRDQLAAAESKLGPLTERAAKGEARADAAEAAISTLRDEIGGLQTQIASAATVMETDAIRREAARADALEKELQRREDSIEGLIEERVALERKAAIIMPDLNMRGMPPRQIWATVIRRLDAQADISQGMSDAYLQGKFDSLLDQYNRNARSHRTISDVIVQHQQNRADQVEGELDAKRKAWRNMGNLPLPNSREANKGRV